MLIYLVAYIDENKNTTIGKLPWLKPLVQTASLCVVAIEKEAFGSPPTTVANLIDCMPSGTPNTDNLYKFKLLQVLMSI